MRRLNCCCFFLIIPFFTYAQGNHSVTGLEIFNSDLKRTADGIIHVASQPLHWSEGDFLLFGGTITAGALFFPVDNKIDGFFRRNQTNRARKWAKLGSAYGEPVTVVSLTAALYTFGIISGDEWSRETAVILTSALIPAGAVQTISKLSAGRARPYMGLGNENFKFWRKGEDYYSFVSGHTLVAMSTSLVLAERIKNTYASAVLYGMAGLSAWSRMYLRNHFSSDVFLGTALSFATVYSALNAHSEKPAVYKDKNSAGFSFNASINNITVQIHF